MGRPRKSAELKRLEGNRGRRDIIDDPEVTPIADASVPDGMPEAQAVFWNLYAPYLVKNGLLTDLNVTDLRRLCYFEAEAVDIQEKVARGDLPRWQEKKNYHGEVVDLGDSAPVKTLKANTSIIRQLKADLRIRTDKMPKPVAKKVKHPLEGFIGGKKAN